MTCQLDLEDIQHFLLTRTPALAARYEFLNFANAAAGRTWLAGLVDKVGTGQSVGNASPDARWVTIAFTCNGLRALGVDDRALATFPEEFRHGMADRAEILGIAGDSRPDRWVGDLASPALHAIVVLFARDAAERDRCERQHRDYLSTLTGVTALSALNLEALPPFDGVAREHFGYRDRLSQPVIAGTGEEPTPGSEPPVKAGEFFLGYDDESGVPPPLPQPEVLSRNGSYLAYLRMEEHVGAFREFLRQQSETQDQQELLAAKLMGRWRSGAPLALCPDKDDPALGADPQRTNDFLYKEGDPHGYRCPIGAHIRRMNPRDTAENMQRRKMLRRGGTLRAGVAGGRAGRRRRTGHRRVHRLFESDSSVRIRDECLGQRSEVQGSGQRARPDRRQSRRHVRHDDSQAPHSQTASRSSGVSVNPPFSSHGAFHRARHKVSTLISARAVGLYSVQNEENGDATTDSAAGRSNRESANHLRRSHP